MARDNDSGQPQFPSGFGTFFGNLVADPKRISDTTTGLRVASNYRTHRGDEGAHYVDVVCFGGYAKAALEWDKGTRVAVTGDIYGNIWGDKGSEKQDITLTATAVSLDNRFYGSGGGGGGSKRSSRDDDDDDRGSRRSRRGSDDDKGGSKRRSRDDDDKGSKKGKSSDDSGSTRRRRRSVADDDD